MRCAYINGRVYTGERFVTAFVTDGDRFLYAGDDMTAVSLTAMFGLPGDVVDLEGRFVCAGFNDSHMHLLSLGDSLRKAPLDEHTGSLAEMLAFLKDFLASHPVREGGFLLGRGWNQDLFSDTDRMPDRFDLDKVSTEVPIAVTRCCGHIVAVNSRALELAGITADTPAIDGGDIGMTETAEGRVPSGLLADNAMDLVYRLFPQADLAGIKERLSLAQTLMNRCGVTSVQSDDYCVFPHTGWETVNEAYRQLEEEGDLTVRVYEQANFTDPAAYRDFLDKGGKTGTGDSLFKMGPLKMVADGALGARTAYLTRTYADAPETRGLPCFSQETLDEMIGTCHEAGCQAAVHAIGDACLDMVLNAYEKAMEKDPRPDARHGIVHCQVSRADQLERMAALGMHIYAQPIFLDYDIKILAKRVGEELASTSYRWHTLADMGLTVSSGTDCPVEGPSPLRGIQCAVTRKSLDGSVGPLHEDEAMTVREAIDSYTWAGALASFEETEKGKIEEGMLADFVVLGADLFETEPEKIHQIPVLMTVLGGRTVFGSLL